MVHLRRSDRGCGGMCKGLDRIRGCNIDASRGENARFHTFELALHGRRDRLTDQQMDQRKQFHICFKIYQ